MSLFEADTTVADIGTRRTSNLPTPTRQRFMPLRAGILNVWEYDDQQLWFTDGRLLLRGRNEAGKSKALELLFPFVLDGDMSPKKLDPFDTISKTMWWNMVGFDKDNRKNPIGYLWLEFGRLDETGGADYVTVIVGMHASSAEKKVTPWFAVTGQRVDVDLDLQPGQLPLNQDAFAKALDGAARFTTTARAHRANVANRLFAMSPERYDNLLHLLRQLRKPKLADKLDRKKLSTVLTDALPPLDDARIEPLATGFGYLDDDIEQLNKTEAAHRATGTFLDVYRGYARSQVRVRGDAVRTATTVFDNVTREEKNNTRALEDAQARSAELTKEAARTAIELAAASGSLEALDLSAVETLNSLRQIAADKAEILDTVTRGVDVAAKLAEEARATLDDANTEAAAARTALDEAAAAARRTADRAAIGGTWDTPADHETNAPQLAAAVTERRALVNAVRAADDRATDARQRLAVAEHAVSAAAAALDDKREQLEAAGREADDARSCIEDAIDRWMAAATRHRPADDASAVADELAEILLRGDRAARTIAARLTADAVNAAAAAVADATGDAANAATRLAAARSALADHDSKPEEQPPPLRAGIAATRAGLPLWLAVDFTDTVTGDEAALLEAALHAAGLLDAVLTSDGLVDADTDDTVLIAAPSGHGIRDWLRPSDGVDTDLVNAVLATIGAGEASGTSCWVALDGSWANGPLTGCWTKATAEHIGAGARAAAHARRREELAGHVAAAETAAATAAADLAAATAEHEQAVGWRDDFPSIVDWAAAEAALDRANSAADTAHGEHEKAVGTRARVNDEVGGLLAAVDAAVAVAGCTPAEVAVQLELLHDCERATMALQSAATTHRVAAAAAASARSTAEARNGERDAAESERAAAELVATAARTKYETALRTSGATVEALLAEKERLEAQVRGLRDREQQIGGATTEAAATVARAQAVLEETGRRRVEATAARDGALVALAALVRSGHVALAVVTDADREAADFLQPYAGRNLARQIAATVSDDEGTDDARRQATDRLVSEFRRLQDAVGTDFDPHLETDADVWVASATLNGELIGIAELHRALADDVEQRQKAIAAEERALIEQHLRDEVGEHLGNCLHAATMQVQRMNAILREHKTNSGAVVQLHWRVDDDAGPAVRDAVRALLTSSQTRDETAAAQLATFLTERVALARRGDIDGADLAERLIAALDYRHWHTFGLTYKTSGGEGELTQKSVATGSGGQQAKISHLPLLAAAAGFYSSSPSAPRLCFLDEAFAGIDGPNTNDLLAMSVTLDLDMVMTNFDAWFCTPELPGLAIYHLEKLPGAVGVAAIRYQWDGVERAELDPWLDG